MNSLQVIDQRAEVALAFVDEQELAVPENFVQAIPDGVACVPEAFEKAVAVNLRPVDANVFLDESIEGVGRPDHLVQFGDRFRGSVFGLVA